MQPDAERFFPQSADTVENLRQNAACGHVGTQRRTYGLCTGMSRTAPQRRKEIREIIDEIATDALANDELEEENQSRLQKRNAQRSGIQSWQANSRRQSGSS